VSIDQLAVSPDGQRIAYITGQYGCGTREFELWVTDANGQGARRIARRAYVTSDLEWSPGSDRILYQPTFQDTRILNRDGSGERRLFSRQCACILFDWLPIALTRVGPRGAVRCAGRPATLFGTSGADRLRGTRRRDVIAGRGGDDVISGLGGNDLICGGAGKDVLRGGAGNDVLRGERGNDRLIGGDGRDLLRGGPGRDSERQ
jgi:Ca2+-binding RTX toxin-like protein